MAVSHLFAALAGAGAGALTTRLRGSGVTRTARMIGSSLAAPSAAAWVTDFLNAAYYAKDAERRDLDDLRLASMVLATYAGQQGRARLGARDVWRFHDAFGTARLRGTGGRTGTLDGDALRGGAARLLGGWFPDAVDDPKRSGWGLAFPTAEAKSDHDPEQRLELSQIGVLTPPRRPRSEQVWHTYPPVAVPDVDATAAALLAVEHWPRFASELGRFTPLRRGGLDGQTFEIEVVGFPTPRTPVFTRAYVTVQNLVSDADPQARHTWVSDVRSGFSERPHELSPIPDDAEVHVGFDLVCHEGHFMGDAMNRLVLYSIGGQGYLRAAGTWDPMVWHLSELYERVGRAAQHAFWGMARPEESMLHQISAQVERGWGATAVTRA